MKAYAQQEEEEDHGEFYLLSDVLHANSPRLQKHARQ